VDRGDSIIDESNYLTALDMLNAAATEDTDATTSPDVIDGRASHWAHGSLRTIFVRVYTGPHFTCCAPGCDEDHADMAYRRAGQTPTWACPCPGDYPEHEVVIGDFTPAWREAVRIMLALRDYPILDESDFSERESVESDRQLDEAISDAGRDLYDLDGDDELVIREAFFALLADEDETRERVLWGDYPNVDYDEVSALYRRVRDTFYAVRGHEFLAAERAAEILPGQLTLPGMTTE
jgi:hypothetical protein